MIALLIPVVFLALITIITLGISFFCIEMVIRLIGHGLGVSAAAVAPAEAVVEMREASREVEHDQSREFAIAA